MKKSSELVWKEFDSSKMSIQITLAAEGVHDPYAENFGDSDDEVTEARISLLGWLVAKREKNHSLYNYFL